MEAHDTPALRNSSSESFVRTWSLFPPPKPPPWMKMTSGVGLSDLAFHRSMTLNFLSLPYTTLVMSGGAVEPGSFGGALGAAFFALGFSSCAVRRAVPRSAVINPMPTIRRYFMSCLLFECSEDGSPPRGTTHAYRTIPSDSKSDLR